MGLQELADFESQLRFFKKNKRTDFFVWTVRIKTYFMRKSFMQKAQAQNIPFVKQLAEFKNLATMIYDMLKDQGFNMAPVADVYSSSDPQEEEAIKCIEALARIPQQMAKWGHPIVQFTTPNLYDVYYNDVIPGCIKAYKNMSGVDHVQNGRIIAKPVWRKIKDFFKRKAKVNMYY
jgi:hypothetical protein